MNIFILDTPRGNVTKRFRYVHLFRPPLRAPTNVFRLLVGEFATTSNRGRKRV